VEIERKWLIDKNNPPYALEGGEVWETEQAYLAFDPVIRIRSVNGTRFFLTVKSLPRGHEGSLLSREEYEIPIPRKTFENLRKKAEGTVLSKTRYRVCIGDNLLAETDFFHGELEGLAYLEIEFPDEKTARDFPDPPGVLMDVSDDPLFTNAALARRGYPERAKIILSRG